MSEGQTGEGISRDEALEIAARKLQARRVRVTDQYPATTITTKEHSVPELVAAHYEKGLSKLPEGKLRDVLKGLENLTYDGAKVVGLGVGAADMIAGGLLTGRGAIGVVTGRDSWSLRTLTLARGDRLTSAARLLGGLGMLRYMPVTAVARTALNVTL